MISPGRALRDLLALGPVVAPTAYDMVAAKIIAEAGFDAVFCSGYGQAASALGKPDGSLTLDVAEARAAAMVASVDVPVIVDADSGFEDPRETFIRIVAAGAAAVMIEDEISHKEGKTLIPTDEMTDRIKEGISVRTNDAVFIARTDVRLSLGLEEAIHRGQAYATAGADVVFIAAPQSLEELAAIPPSIPCQSMANVVPDSRIDSASVEQLARFGFHLILFGLLDLMVAAAALRQTFAELRTGGRIESVNVPRISLNDLNTLIRREPGR